LDTSVISVASCWRKATQRRPALSWGSREKTLSVPNPLGVTVPSERWGVLGGGRARFACRSCWVPFLQQFARAALALRANRPGQVDGLRRPRSSQRPPAVPL